MYCFLDQHIYDFCCCTYATVVILNLSDCCTCAPTGFNFETGFEGRSVHENACMSDIAVAAASSSPPILSAPCQVDWDICTWFYLRVSCVCIVYASMRISKLTTPRRAAASGSARRRCAPLGSDCHSTDVAHPSKIHIFSTKDKQVFRRQLQLYIF